MGPASGGFGPRGISRPTGTGTGVGRSPGATGPDRGPGTVKRGGAEGAVVVVGAPPVPGDIGGVIGTGVGPGGVPVVGGLRRRGALGGCTGTRSLTVPRPTAPARQIWIAARIVRMFGGLITTIPVYTGTG